MGTSHRGPRTRSSLSPILAVSIVALVGALISASLGYVAWNLNRNNNRHLLQEQTRQAAAVISSSVLAIAGPLTTALKIEVATGGTGPQFNKFMAAYVGPGRLFVSAAVWEIEPQSVRSIATLGTPPALEPGSARAVKLAAEAMHSSTFVIANVHSGQEQRIGYAVADTSGAPVIIYAERAIPADRRVAVEANSAFSDLDFATYLGPTTNLADLATTDLPDSALPLEGNVAHVTIPFGNSSITLVATPRGQLGGSIGVELPWFLLIGGALLTALTAAAANLLVRRRQVAERDAHTIAGLYDRLDALYGEQRTISETLQRALLPQQNPLIENLEIASRYVAGAAGVEVGGDWYSVVAVDARHFAFVVGDVSGRGIGAATIMARLRFTIRAYLFEGHPPEIALAMTGRQLDVTTDGYIATVLVGVGDIFTGEIVLASAGHLSPLIIEKDKLGYVPILVGPPLGTGSVAYEAVTINLNPGASLMAFTDGLVERRGESVDAGLNRLLSIAATPPSDLDGWMSNLVSAMEQNDAQDDVAVLVIRWNPTHDRLGDRALQLD